MARYVVRVARSAGLIILFLAAAILGIVSGVLFAYAGDLPGISALDDYAPSTISRVYGARGEIVGEFAIQRREVIPYEAIPPKLRQAILAAEDSEFEQHFGLSIPRIIVTLVKDIMERRKAGGASTLTQQLTRKLFLTDEKTWERKIKEAILAIQIEKRYTKREIFTFYCNQMYFGHGVYGVEAASRLYFGKSAKDLSLEEAALIAGILQGNVRQSPYVNRDAAMRRRNYTLTRMADVGYITAAEAEAARKKPIVVRDDPPSQTYSVAPYFLEEVRKELESRYGAKQLYENGLSVQTALDLNLQEAANKALDEGLRRVDKRRGFRKPRRNVRAGRPCNRHVPAASLGQADARRRRRAGSRDDGGCHVDSDARGKHARHDRSQGLRLDGQDVTRSTRDARRSRRGAIVRTEGGRRHRGFRQRARHVRDRNARTDAGGRRRRYRDRQPHRSD